MNFLKKVWDKIKNLVFGKNAKSGKQIIQEILDLEEARGKLKKGTQEYDAVQAELAKEYDILKKYRESRHGIKPELIIGTAAMFILGAFAISLDRESPKAVKMAQFILKIIPIKFG